MAMRQRCGMRNSGSYTTTTNYGNCRRKQQRFGESAGRSKAGHKNGKFLQRLASEKNGNLATARDAQLRAVHNGHFATVIVARNSSVSAKVRGAPKRAINWSVSIVISVRKSGDLSTVQGAQKRATHTATSSRN